MIYRFGMKNKNEFVVIVTNNYYPVQGGITTYVDNLQSGLSKKGISNKVFSRQTSFKPSAIIRYFLIVCWYLKIVVFCLGLKIKGYKIIIHSHSANYCMVISFIIQKIFKARSIHTFHSPLKKADFILRKFTSRIDCIVYVSNMTKELYRRLSVPQNSNEYILSGGINLSPYLKFDKQYNNNSKNLLFVGRITEEKGILESLKVLKYIKNDYKEYRIIGKPQTLKQKKYQNQLNEYMIENNLEGRVKFLGSKYGDSLIQEYINADLFILPSIWEEPAPMVIAEAFAAGCPIIAFDTGGLKERIVNNKNGILVEKENIKKFANAITFVLKSKERYMKFSNNAKVYAINNLSVETMILRHLPIYGIK